MTIAYNPPPGVPGGASLISLAAWASRVREVVSGLLQGRMNVTGEVVLDAGTSTVLQDPRLSVQSVLHMDALTPDAAGLEWFALPEERSSGEWLIRHPAGGAARTLRYAILG